MHLRKLGRGSIAMLAGGAVVLAVGGVAVASIPNSDGVIDGCYNSGSGALRVIDTSSQQCSPKETSISWNQQGSPGSPGAPGERGPAGPQGSAGASDVTAMGDEAYLTCVGNRQGAFNGPVTTKGFEKSVAVNVAGHAIISPSVAGSGQSTGKRQHKPFTITKSVDKTSPLFYSSVITSETLNTCTIKFVQPSGTGAPDTYYIVKLTNATVGSIEFKKGDVRGAAGRFGEYEEISFTYQKIEWTITEGGITATDDWESAVT